MYVGYTVVDQQFQEKMLLRIQNKMQVLQDSIILSRLYNFPVVTQDSIIRTL